MPLRRRAAASPAQCGLRLRGASRTCRPPERREAEPSCRAPGQAFHEDSLWPAAVRLVAARLSRHAHELGHGDAALLRHLEMEMEDSERRGAMKQQGTSRAVGAAKHAHPATLARCSSISAAAMLSSQQSHDYVLQHTRADWEPPACRRVRICVMPPGVAPKQHNTPLHLLHLVHPAPKREPQKVSPPAGRCASA